MNCEQGKFGRKKLFLVEMDKLSTLTKRIFPEMVVLNA